MTPIDVFGYPGVPLVMDVIWDVSGQAVGFILDYVLSMFYQVLLILGLLAANVIGTLSVTFLDHFLFIPKPRHFGNLVDFHERMQWLAFLLYTTMTLGYLALYQVLPSIPEISLERYFKRSFMALLIILGGGFFIDIAIDTTQMIARDALFPGRDGFVLRYPVMVLGDLSAAEAIGTSFTLILVLLVYESTTFLSLLLLGLMIAARGVLIYTTYALLPLIAIAWILDYGPFERVNSIINSYLSIVGIMFVIPIMISGILFVGGALASPDTASAPIDQFDATAQPHDTYQDMVGMPASQIRPGDSFSDVTAPAGPSVAASSDSGSGPILIVRVGAYFGAISLSGLLATRFMSMLIAGGKIRQTARSRNDGDGSNDDADESDDSDATDSDVTDADNTESRGGDTEDTDTEKGYSDDSALSSFVPGPHQNPMEDLRLKNLIGGNSDTGENGTSDSGGDADGDADVDSSDAPTDVDADTGGVATTAALAAGHGLYRGVKGGVQAHHRVAKGIVYGTDVSTGEKLDEIQDRLSKDSDDSDTTADNSETDTDSENSTETDSTDSDESGDTSES